MECSLDLVEIVILKQLTSTTTQGLTLTAGSGTTWASIPVNQSYLHLTGEAVIVINGTETKLQDLVSRLYRT